MIRDVQERERERERQREISPMVDKVPLLKTTREPIEAKWIKMV